MRAIEAPEALWAQLSDFIVEKMGLHFPKERWGDLKRGVADAVRELGRDDIAGWVEDLITTPPERAKLELLASHLTIGETYFFRDKATFDALATHILPELIHARRPRERRLRIWSAACCTGEEAYSLAMLLHELLPDRESWHLSILATDINTRFLRKAGAGVYSDWSFRGTPSWVKDRYCTRLPDGRHAVRPEIRRAVTFAQLNLVDDVYPLLASATNAIDVILCRNALMYFSASQARRVVARLHRSLVEGGWLIVSPSEASQILFSSFATVNAPGAILYRKVRQGEAMAQQLEDPVRPAEFSTGENVSFTAAEATPVAPAPSGSADGLYLEGRYTDQDREAQPRFAGHGALSSDFRHLARSLANLGRLEEALAACDRWIATDKFDPVAHYFRAIVQLEQGAAESAIQSLWRSLYLRPDFALAYVALGHASRARGRQEEAARHFTNALDLLSRVGRHELVPESDGLTAGRLSEMITTLLQANALS